MLPLAIFSLLIAHGFCDVEVLGNAKNVILVVANGLSPASVTSARIQEAVLSKNSSHLLSFETFPHHGLLKTYDGEFKARNQVTDKLPIFYGTYDQSGNIPDDNKTLFMSAHKNRKAIGLVTTSEMEELLPTLNRIGLSKCPGSNKYNCSDSSCYVLCGCLGINPDIIVGMRSRPEQLNYTICSQLEHGKNKTVKLFERPKRMYFNSTEEFEKLEAKEGVKLFGLFSEKDTLLNKTGQKLSKFKIINVVEKSIKILRNSPNGYFMVVMVNYSDGVQAVKVASELSAAIKRVVSIKDTLLVVTSDLTSKKLCENERNKDNFPGKDLNSSDVNKMAIAKPGINSTSMTNSSLKTTTTSSIVSPVNSKSHCSADKINSFADVPVYTWGPYPVKMAAVQDQAKFGLNIMKILEAKHYEDIKFNSEIGELDSDMFHKDIKAAMEEIDEMTKELFNDWL